MIRSRNGYLKTPNYAHANNATPVSVDDDEFTTSVDAILGAVTEQTRMVYIANPENPAGTYLGDAEIRRLHALPCPITCCWFSIAPMRNTSMPPITTRVTGSPRKPITSSSRIPFPRYTGWPVCASAGYTPTPNIVDMVSRIGLTFPVATPSVSRGHGRTRPIASICNRVYRNQSSPAPIVFRRDAANSGSGFTRARPISCCSNSKTATHPAAGCAEYLSHRGISIAPICFARPTKTVFA